MDLDSIMLSEITQAEKDKCCMISSIVESKKQNKNKTEMSQKYREQTSGCQRGSRWWEGRNR